MKFLHVQFQKHRAKFIRLFIPLRNTYSPSFQWQCNFIFHKASTIVVIQSKLHSINWISTITAIFQLFQNIETMLGNSKTSRYLFLQGNLDRIIHQKYNIEFDILRKTINVTWTMQTS